jgi:hypothetical protein
MLAIHAAMTIPPTPLWREVQAEAHCLISRQATALVSYCRRQTNKYGIKGWRMASVRKTLGLLITTEEEFGKLEVIEGQLAALAASTDHVSLLDLPISGDRFAILRFATAKSR